MGRHIRLLGEFNGEATTWAAFAATGNASPFTPEVDGRLVGLRPVVNRAAASSLINHVEIRLTCATFSPNMIEIGVQGSGLQTAPALSGGANSYCDYSVDQPVKAGVPITLEARNISETDTPVTVSVLLYGVFETAG